MRPWRASLPGGIFANTGDLEMRKVTLILLAASAAVAPAAASAQVQSGVHSGQSFRHGGPNVVVRHHGGGVMHPGPDFRHRRLQRGFMIHPFWFGPQFHVQNWQMYGFAQPAPDHRWVRYYDDAYLIDRGGRVMDSRHGLDWDRYGERWEMDDGIPAYHGSRDYRPDERDYDWAERHDGRDYEERGGRGYGHGSGGSGYGAPMAHPGCGCSYGYGYAYPIIIETTVTESAGTYEVVEEVVEVRRRHRPRRVRQAPRPRPPVRRAPRPSPGERG